MHNCVGQTLNEAFMHRQSTSDTNCSCSQLSQTLSTVLTSLCLYLLGST
jgi:hypothetical protein